MSKTVYSTRDKKKTSKTRRPLTDIRNEPEIRNSIIQPLPNSEDGKNWMRWIELFSLTDATAETCACILIDYWIPRTLISENGTQFVSAVMQQMAYCLDIMHTFTPAYHPEALN